MKQANRRDAAFLAGVTVAGMLAVLWGSCFLIAPVWQAGNTAGFQEPLPTPQPCVDPNTADIETLMTLPDIGRQKAEAILAYRTENGPFLCVEDLDNVPGISAQMVQTWADCLTLDPEF